MVTRMILSNLIDRAMETSTFSVTLADATRPDVPLSYVNPAFETLTGYTAGDALGRNCRFLQGPETEAASVHAISNAIREARSVTTTLLNYRKNGTKFWNRFQLSPVKSEEGNIIAYLGVQIDMTHDLSISAIETERQKMEALGRLAGGVAHEINNALQPIRLWGDMLDGMIPSLPDSLQSDARICVDGIREHSVFARDVVERILAFGRRAKDQSEPADLVVRVEDAVGFSRSLLPGGTTITTEHAKPEDGVQPQISVDRTRFIQVFTNLVINASDAMDGRGRVHIASRIRNVDGVEAGTLGVAAGRYAAITVADTGPGIPPEIRDDIFDPFYTTKSGGTGLGLFTVQGIMRTWGGAITLKPSVGSGTVFEILIPLHTEGTA